MIEVEKLSKIYGKTTALKDVSFHVNKGEILGFLGPNGAGKTTTMRILSGYLPATTGIARIAGFEVHEQTMAVRQVIGYLPEVPPLYPEMTVADFLYFVTRIKQVPAGDRSRRVDIALSKCGLLEKRQVLIKKLSKGFRQRVGVAQALVHDPPVIILDEPTVGLDPRQIIEVRNLIKSLADDHTIILSTHILPEVSMTCHRVAIINKGEIVLEGTPDQMIAQLAKSEGYYLEITGELELINQSVNLIKNLPGVINVEIINNLSSNSPNNSDLLQAVRENSDQPVIMKITCEALQDLSKEIVGAIVKTGLTLSEMRKNKASLEDVFLDVTTGATMKEVKSDYLPGDHIVLQENVDVHDNNNHDQSEDVN
jgi:ABC-2 type transport system ATP-binding protein